MSRISIIIPSYRQPQFLGRAIESCLEQDHDDLEIIVIDDRSRDASLGLAVAWAQQDERIVVLEAHENGGLGRTRNIGLAHATGEYLCFLDSDDYLLPDSLRARLDAFPAAIAEFGETVVAVYGDWQHVGEYIDYPTVRAPRSNMEVVDAQSFTGENVFICSAPLVRRDAVMDAGGFPEGLPMLEDFALWAKMIAAGGVFVPVRHVVATYRQRPNSMLRGESGVVMASYVDVINHWVEQADVSLADGGGLSAWLDNREPFSYGRMAWTTPSTLGSRHSTNAASSLRSSSSAEDRSVRPQAGVDDFMSKPVNGGLALAVGPDRVEPWSGSSPLDYATAISVASLRDCVVAIGMAEDLTPGSWAIVADDPSDWQNLWPLALAGIAALSSTQLVTGADAPEVIELPSSGADINALVQRGAEVLWGEEGPRADSLVYVPAGFESHPALDAWISVALHSLADAGLNPRLMADASSRDHLGGYRSDITSIAALRATSVVVAPPSADRVLLEALAPLIIFDPSSTDPVGPATAGDLVRAVGDLAV